MSVENNFMIIKKFINHGLEYKYITKNTTIEEFLKYLNNIETNWLPKFKEFEEILKIEKSFE